MCLYQIKCLNFENVFSRLWHMPLSLFPNWKNVGLLVTWRKYSIIPAKIFFIEAFHQADRFLPLLKVWFFVFHIDTNESEYIFVTANHKRNHFLYVLMGERDICVSDRDIKWNGNVERVKKWGIKQTHLLKDRTSQHTILSWIMLYRMLGECALEQILDFWIIT